MSKQISAGDLVMDARDNLNPKVATVTEILGNKAKVTWRDRTQSTRSLRGLTHATTELVTQRQRALEAWKRANKSACYYFGTADDASEFAALDVLKPYRHEFFTSRNASKPHGVRIFGLENWECDRLLATNGERLAA